MTKASERIAKAKRKYVIAEDAADGIMRRVVDFRYTLIVVVLLCVAGIVVYFV